MPRYLSVLMLLMLAPTVTKAQDARALPREGFGISFGFGAGSAGAACDFCSSDRTTGLSGYLRLGGHPNPQTFVGFESNGWVNSENGIDESLGFYSGVIQFYPNVHQGFYLKGGLGLSLYTATDGVDEVTGTALGFAAGIGYDIRVGRNFSLTPYVNFLTSTKGELKVNDVGSDLNVSANLIQFGLGFTWH